MKFISPFLLLPFLFTLSLWSASPVPYSGKIDIRGVNYFGEAQFAFSLHDGNGTTHWRNGKHAGETIKVTIRNGRYNVLLGGQGMNSLPPELFLNHDKLYLKVEVDMGDGEGLRHLAPDQLITATPRALVADIAKVAQRVGNGAITREMLSSEVLAKLDANATASPSTPITITRDMLPQDVRDDLNKTVTITRNMLPADVLADLNKSSTTASPITLSMLAPEVTAKLDQNVSGGNGVVAGSLISVPYGQSAPAGYSLYQQGTPKELVWEEKAPVSVARKAYDGVEVLNGNIYFVGGHGKDQLDDNLSTDIDINERYNPNENSWQKLQEISNARNNISSVVFDNKLWILGGYNSVSNFNTVEFYDPVLDNWSQSTQLPVGIRGSNAIFVNGHIYLIGGFTDQTSNKVFSFEPITKTWAEKANLPTPRYGLDLVWFQNRIWAIGGQEFQGETKDVVESYDPISDSWKTETSLKTKRSFPVSWVADGKIFVGGGAHLDSDSNNSSNFIYSDSLELYGPATNQWSYFGKLPEKKYLAGSVVLNNKVYVIGGSTASGVYSNKVFAADLNASVAGVYDLYRKDGNASAGTPLVQAEVADGSVTASKIANKTIGKDQISDSILKYLKPEITTQPQAQAVYADTNASFSVTAEGKYLTYQWKKDGSSLTGETNATLNITDANATLHDGNYSVVVSNDFGSVETTIFEQEIISWHPKLLNELILWADASDSSTVINSNSKVSRWEDKSGLANHFTQTVENNMPLFGVDKINDLNALSGDNTFMTTNNNPFGASVSDAFVTMVVKIKNITDCNFINLRGGGDNFNERWGGFVVQSWNQLLFDVSGVNSPYRLSANIDWNVSDQIIFSFYSTVTGSVQQVWKNGSLLIGDSNTDASLTDGGIRIGNLNGFALGEVFIVNGQVSSHARIASEGYLAHKWGLSANLPSAHLYKNTAP